MGWRRSFRFLLFSSALGCSSSPGGDDDSWIPSDIDQQATLDAIGAAGYAKVCSAFADYVHDTYRSQLLVKAACTAHALQTTTDAVMCGAELDACLDTLPPVVDQQLEQILAQASCAVIGLDPDGCPSTVSALKGCLDALGDLVDQVELSATCAAFGSPVPSDWWMIPEPAACATLRTGC